MSLSQAVVDAVARREKVEPENLEPPLYEAVDPDALDSLFEDNHTSRGTISFMYKGYRVVVDSTGAVRLNRGAEQPELAAL